MVKKNFKFAAFFILSGIIVAPLYSMDPDQEMLFSSLLDQIKTENINLSHQYDPTSPLAQALSALAEQCARNDQSPHQYLLAPQIKPEKKIILHQRNSFISSLRKLSNGLLACGAATLRKLSNGLLACGAANGNILIIDPIKQQLLTTLEGHTGQIFSMIKFGKDQLLSSSFDRTINLWNVNTGERISTFTSHSATVTSLAKIDEERFASASFNGEIKIWSILHGEIKHIEIEDKKKNKPIHDLVVVDNGLLASTSNGGCIAFWNIETGECINTIKAHQRRINSLILLKNKMLASASADGRIKIWDPQSSKNIYTIFNNDEIESLIELDNGNIAARSGMFGIKIWSSTTGKLQNSIPCENLFSTIEQLDDGNIVYAEGYTKIMLCNLYSQKTISWFREALKDSPKHIALLLLLEKYREASEIVNIHYDWFRTFNATPIHYQGVYFPHIAVSIE